MHVHNCEKHSQGSCCQPVDPRNRQQWTAQAFDINSDIPKNTYCGECWSGRRQVFVRNRRQEVYDYVENDGSQLKMSAWNDHILSKIRIVIIVIVGFDPNFGQF